jgi:NADPH:quinone reductase-like Zn-dependent oxidoreductase
MRAAVLHEHDEPPRAGEFEDPVEGDGCVVAEVAAAGVTHLDLLKASGLFYTGPPPLPSVVGSDGVGRPSDGRVWPGR